MQLIIVEVSNKYVIILKNITLLFKQILFINDKKPLLYIYILLRFSNISLNIYILRGSNVILSWRKTIQHLRSRHCYTIAFPRRLFANFAK